MLERVPWFTGGGAEHSVEVARVLSYAATNGARGIVGPGDLQCRALAVPSTKVRIAPGVAVMPNFYPGGYAQSYIGRNPTETLLDVPATDSSGPKSWLVLLRVGDPQYPGTAIPADPNDFDYQQFVLVPAASTATDLSLAARLYPCIVIARITMPTSTATVLQAYVTDLRQMANPRRKRDLNTAGLLAVESQTSTNLVDGERWPNEAFWPVKIPEWATQVRVRGDWGQILIPPGNVVGYLWVQIGEADATKLATQRVTYDTPGATQNHRASFICADTMAIGAVLRGTTQYVGLRATNTFILTGGTAARLQANAGSAVVCDLEFLEAPTADDW